MGNKEQLWVVVKSIQQKNNVQGYLLEQGDIIKMGRIELRVRDIQLNPNKKQDFVDSSSLNSYQQNLLCRVCLSERQTSENPLINPCKCTGTMKYVHLNCLQYWLRQKLHSKQNESCTIYLWKDLECELCKFSYPPIFMSDGVKYDLVELSKPYWQPYMLLELKSKRLQSANQLNEGDEFSQQAVGVYIISFEQKNEVKLGRGHEAEVRIQDISVSRLHTSLKMVDKKIYISDLNSKFGTLIQIKQNFILDESLNGVEFQVGRSNVKVEFKGSILNQC